MKMSLVICGLIGSMLIAQPACAERVALVIGNSNYGAGLELKNPVNDARAVAASLRKLNFKVIERLDQDLKGMEDSLLEFNRVLKEGDMAWFFYAGHGLQADNANYLLPIGADVRESFELKRKTVDLDTIKGAMLASKARLNVVVLDCCRDNPLTRRWTRSTARGLTPVQNVPEGMIVAFSTAENQTALDGEGANSPYSSTLVNVLDSRPADGLEIKELFFTVARTVKKDIGQVPYLTLDATMDKYFLDRDTVSAVADPTAAAAAIFQPAPVPQATVSMPPAPVPAPMPQAMAVAPLTPGNSQPPTQIVYITPPGVTNNLSGVFANGPYAAFNSYSQGQILRKVQEKLQSAGLYKSKVDGGMGAGTQTAINAWQQTNGLTVTGLLDQATLQHMMLLGLAEQNAPARASSGTRKSSSSSRSKSRSSDDDDGGSSGGGSNWMKWIPRGGGPRFGF